MHVFSVEIFIVAYFFFFSAVTLLQNYTFPESIVFNASSFLAEIVVDVLNDKAIIADSGTVRSAAWSPVLYFLSASHHCHF